MDEAENAETMIHNATKIIETMQDAVSNLDYADDSEDNEHQGYQGQHR